MLSKLAIPALLPAAALLALLAFWAGLVPDHSDTRPPMSSVFEPSEEFQFDPPEPGSYVLHNIKPAPDGDVLDHSRKRSNPVRTYQGKNLAGQLCLSQLRRHQWLSVGHGHAV